MLVASSAVGLIAPIGVLANDINIEGMNSYSSSSSSSKKQKLNSKTFASEIATVNEKIDGLESQSNDFEASGFSDTTVLSGKTIFSVGGLENDSGDISEVIDFNYTYQMNLNTSFSGDDNLYVRLKSGNTSKNVDPFGTAADGSYLSSTNTNGDALKVDKIWYQFPVGEKNTVWIGPRIENYYMHGASPSIYSPTLKQFKLGGNGAAYGASTDSGVGWAYKADNGFSISSNIVSKGGLDPAEDAVIAQSVIVPAVTANGATAAVAVAVVDTVTTAAVPASAMGFLTGEAKTNWSTQVAYTTDRYHVSALVALKYNDWEDSYYSTTAGKARTDGSTNYGLRAYWRPDDSGSAVPEISVGYDTSSVQNQDADTNAYFIGLTWKDLFQGSDKIGLAFGRPQTSSAEAEDPFTWEAYYSFKPNDSMEIRPSVFGYQSARGTADRDYTGVVLETTFKF